jgi:hypothetical protein
MKAQNTTPHRNPLSDFSDERKVTRDVSSCFNFILDEGLIAVHFLLPTLH